MRNVKIVNTTGNAIGTKIIDAETGEELLGGVAEVSISIKPFDAVVAEMQIQLVQVDFDNAKGRFLAYDPVSETFKEATSIAFADGTIRTL